MKTTGDFTILVDMDDVIEDFLPSWITALNKRFGTSVCVDEVTDWDITLFFPNLSKQQIYEPIHNDDFWDTVLPKKDAVKYLRKLKDEGFRIYICTSTYYKGIKAKMEKVLFRYFNFITWDDVIITTNKQLVNADVLIDDGVHNLIGGSYKGVLMDAPHNRGFFAEQFGITRVRDWGEAYGLIHKIWEESVQ